MTNKNGFTLIEALISVIILSVTLAAGIQLLFNASKITGLVTHKKIAMELINTELELLRVALYSNIINNTTSIAVGGLSGQTITTVVDVDANGNPNPPFAFKQVDIQVLWGEAGENPTTRSYDITTYIAP